MKFPSLEGLKNKLGPLPVWVWGVLAGVIVLASAYLWKVKADAKNADGSVTVSSEDLTDQLAPGVTDTPAASDPLAGGDSNLLWLARAVRYAISKGIDPLKAETALRKYQNGEPMTAEERATVSTIISALGTPPEGILGTPSNAPEDTTVTPKPTTPAANPPIRTVMPEADYREGTSGLRPEPTPVSKAPAGRDGSRSIGGSFPAATPKAVGQAPGKAPSVFANPNVLGKPAVITPQKSTAPNPTIMGGPAKVTPAKKAVATVKKVAAKVAPKGKAKAV